MFTGLVDHCGTVASVERQDFGFKLWLDSRFGGLQIGESIAVDGVCLTVIAIKGKRFQVEVSPETVKRTYAANYERGTSVNLERALRMGDRIGGHFVTGHIDSRGRVKERVDAQQFTRIRFSGVGSAFRRLLIPKGSIAVNGVSLTINEVHTDGFSVMVIPHTFQRTNLSQLHPKGTVNLEYDWMTKVIVSQTRDRLTVLAKVGK